MKTPSEKSRLIAFLLSSFFGVWGVCRFYSGDKKMGAIMLVCSIFIIGLPFSIIMNFIDWVSLLIGSYKDSEGHVISNW